MKKRIIGVCFSGTGEEYQLKIVKALGEYMSGFDIHLLYYACLDNKYGSKAHDDGEYSVFSLIDYDLIDGLIIISESIKNLTVRKKIIQGANEKNVPVVCFDSSDDGADCNVVFDDCGAIESITEHLIKVHGCRSINFMAGQHGQLVSDRRVQSYKDALDKNNIPYEPERVGEGGWWALRTKQVVDKWLEDGMVFDALVCANDNMAMAAADELYNHGLRVPEDVRVTGIDDLYASSCFIPRIATARFKHEEGIRTAVDVLRDIWAGKAVDKTIVLGNDLKFAESCGCVGNEDIKRVNGYAFDLSYKNELIKIFDKHMIRFTNNVTTKQTFEEAVDLIAHYCKRAWTREMWLCVNDGFFDGEVYQGEFADVMQLLIKKDPYDSARTDMKFMRPQTLPGIEEALEDNKSILLMPLHIRENTIGYIAREFTSTEALDEWYIFSMNLCGMLDVIKTHRQLRNVNKRLENMYVHDSMTGLFNRRGFFKELSERFSGREAPELLVVSADLDGLKDINDLYGHSEGDRAIETIALALRYAGGDDFVCARFGGDEFISAGSFTQGAAVSFEERFDDYLERFNESSGLPYRIEASIGIVGDRCRLENIDSIISIADERMYLRKNERKQYKRQKPR